MRMVFAAHVAMNISLDEVNVLATSTLGVVFFQVARHILPGVLDETELGYFELGGSQYPQVGRF